uniref:Putative ovule protein n=1 Tax=Solanum chacoense TaxID=4108 RepID=A0A0V0GTF2_SOLCH
MIVCLTTTNRKMIIKNTKMNFPCFPYIQTKTETEYFKILKSSNTNILPFLRTIKSKMTISVLHVCLTTMTMV